MALWRLASRLSVKLKEKSGEGGRRSYTLLDGEILLVVNTMVRLSGLQFDKGQGWTGRTRAARTQGVEGIGGEGVFTSAGRHTTRCWRALTDAQIGWLRRRVLHRAWVRFGRLWGVQIAKFRALRAP